MWMLLEHPEAELAPDFRLADPFDNLHLPVAQDQRTRAINARVRVTHPDDDARDTAVDNRSRAGRCAAVKRAGFEGRVERRASDTVPPRAGVQRRGDFRVIFTR